VTAKPAAIRSTARLLQAAEKGRSICYVLGQVPGVSITHRNELNAFESEEIDVAIWNDGAPDGFFAF